VREAAFQDLILGNVIVTFDGRVVEFFGENMPGRFHLLMLSMQVSGPTNNGNYVVDFSNKFSGRGGVKLSIAGNDWPDVEPLVAEISAALQQPGS